MQKNSFLHEVGWDGSQKKRKKPLGGSKKLELKSKNLKKLN